MVRRWVLSCRDRLHMKKLKSHDDLKELRVGDLTTWHLAVDTSDVTSGPLSAALWRLQHNDIEAGGKKKKKKRASNCQGGFLRLHVFCEVVCIFLKLDFLSFQQHLRCAYLCVNKCVSLTELNKVHTAAIFRTTYGESLIPWERTGVYPRTHISKQTN